MTIGQNFILQSDNFFDNPNEIREYALNQRFYSHEESKKLSAPAGSYAGVRTQEIHTFNRLFFDNLCQKIFSKVIDLTDVESLDWRVSAYFHLQNSDDFVENTIHKDQGVLYAGLIYLTPEIGEEFGTSLYDEDYKVAKTFLNKYNRLVVYDANINHGPSGFTDGRLTLTFFIKHLDIKYQ